MQMAVHTHTEKSILSGLLYHRALRLTFGDVVPCHPHKNISQLYTVSKTVIFDSLLSGSVVDGTRLHLSPRLPQAGRRPVMVAPLTDRGGSGLLKHSASCGSPLTLVAEDIPFNGVGEVLSLPVAVQAAHNVPCSM